MEQKVKAEIEALFSGKLKRAIAGEVKALQAIKKERVDLQEQIRALGDRAGKAEAAARALADAIDRAILNNETPSKQIREAELRMQEVKTCTAKAELLKNEDLEAQQREQAAVEVLKDAVWRELLNIRGELETRVKVLLQEVLLTCAHFEDQALAAYADQGLDFGFDTDRARELGRFLSAAGIIDNIAPFVEPVGPYESLEFRTRARAKVLG